MAAATAVFHTAELSEMILDRLPMRDVLLLQRVDKYFRELITTSKILQRKLFFRNEAGGPLTFYENRSVFPLAAYSTPYGLTKYKKETYILPATPEEISQFKYMWHDKKKAPGQPVAIQENPILYELEERIDEGFKNGMFGQDSLPEIWRRPEASWRRMLITQPSVACSMQVRINTGNVSPSYRTVSIDDSSKQDLGSIMHKVFRSKKFAKNARRLLKMCAYNSLVFDIHGALLWDETEWDWPGEEDEGEDCDDEDEEEWEDEDEEGEDL